MPRGSMKRTPYTKRGSFPRSLAKDAKRLQSIPVTKLARVATKRAGKK